MSFVGAGFRRDVFFRIVAESIAAEARSYKKTGPHRNHFSQQESCGRNHIAPSALRNCPFHAP